MASTRSKNTSTQFKAGAWSPETLFCGNGLGAEIEGTVEELRFHTVNAKDKVERYIAIVLKVNFAFAVELDKYGVETSFDPKKHGHRVLDHAALHMRFAPPSGLLDATELGVLHPHHAGMFEFWALASTDARHLKVGDAIHLKTVQDSFFIKSHFLTKLGSFQGLAGGAVMQEMSQKANTFVSGKTLPQDEVEGCNSDEWDE